MGSEYKLKKRDVLALVFIGFGLVYIKTYTFEILQNPAIFFWFLGICMIIVLCKMIMGDFE